MSSERSPGESTISDSFWKHILKGKFLSSANILTVLLLNSIKTGVFFFLPRLPHHYSSMQKANEMSGLLASEDKPGHVIGFADPVFGGKSNLFLGVFLRGFLISDLSDE